MILSNMTSQQYAHWWSFGSCSFIFFVATLPRDAMAVFCFAECIVLVQNTRRYGESFHNKNAHVLT